MQPHTYGRCANRDGDLVLSQGQPVPGKVVLRCTNCAYHIEVTSEQFAAGVTVDFVPGVVVSDAIHGLLEQAGPTEHCF